MGARAVLTPEQYLRSSFPDLDKEYRHGAVEDRALPDELHSRTQAFLIAFFYALRQSARLFPRPELRLKLAEKLYLIPDVAVFHGVEPAELVPSTPPLIVIEILSADDSMTAIRRKLEDYRTWGVPHVWLIDPYARRLYICEGGSSGLREVPALTIPDPAIELTPALMFE